MTSPVALLLGPCREAMSGVSTHLNLLFASRLAEKFRLVHFPGATGYWKPDESAAKGGAA